MGEVSPDHVEFGDFVLTDSVFDGGESSVFVMQGYAVPFPKE